MKKEKDQFLKKIVIPAFFTAFAAAVLVLALKYFNFNIKYGIGSSGIIFASFGSSLFLLFMAPKSKTASVRKFVKSYLIGGVIGVAGSTMLSYLPLFLVAFIIIFVASIVLFVADSVHPPAIAIAFAFVLFRIDVYGMVIVASTAFLIVLLKLFFDRFVYPFEK
jgi:CBS-domain-containing membrane protein